MLSGVNIISPESDNVKIVPLEKYIFFLLFLLSVVSCREDELSNTPPIADFTVQEQIDEIYLKDNSTDFEGDPLTRKWHISSSDLFLSSTTLQEVYFRIPQLESPTDITVELRVSDSLNETVKDKNITVPVLSEVRSMGLGMEGLPKKSNEVGYEWYIDQGNTGPYSTVNCGPTSVTMAIRWADILFTGTTIDARNMYRPDGGWWYTNDIIGYLDHHRINFYVVALDNMNTMTGELDKGNIVILCLDMYFIRNEDKVRWHIDRYYRADYTGWGHFIVVKGYRIVDNKLLFEVYDPYGFGKTYNGGQPKGKNRYYRSEDIDNSSNIWWDYAIIVSRSSVKGKAGLDPASIPNKWGGRY